MAASSDSGDGSDLFWPGYVDAVTNLAINLLFVIAVMSIVVLSSILQISKMKPDIPSKDPDAVKAKPLSSKDETNESNKSTAPSESSPFKNKSEAVNIEKIENEKKLIDQKIVSQAELIAKLEKELNQLRTGQALQKSVKGRKDEPGGTDNQAAPAEVINANESKQQINTGENQLLSLSAGGILVVFDKDVINLSEKESAELIKKLTENNFLATSYWQIRVNVPKGFSESARIGYYRVNAIRNILLQNKVDPSKITLRVVESESSSANNARVLVRALQP